MPAFWHDASSRPRSTEEAPRASTNLPTESSRQGSGSAPASSPLLESVGRPAFWRDASSRPQSSGFVPVSTGGGKKKVPSAPSPLMELNPSLARRPKVWRDAPSYSRPMSFVVGGGIAGEQTKEIAGSPSWLEAAVERDFGTPPRKSFGLPRPVRLDSGNSDAASSSLPARNGEETGEISKELSSSPATTATGVSTEEETSEPPSPASPDSACSDAEEAQRQEQQCRGDDGASQRSSPMKLFFRSGDWRGNASQEETHEQLHGNNAASTEEKNDLENGNQSIRGMQEDDEKEKPPLPSFPSCPRRFSSLELSHQSGGDRRFDDASLPPSSERDEEEQEHVYERREQLHGDDVADTEGKDNLEDGNQSITETQEDEEQGKPSVPSFPSCPQQSSPREISHQSRGDSRADEPTSALPSNEHNEEEQEDAKETREQHRGDDGASAKRMEDDKNLVMAQMQDDEEQEPLSSLPSSLQQPSPPQKMFHRTVDGRIDDAFPPPSNEREAGSEGAKRTREGSSGKDGAGAKGAEDSDNVNEASAEAHQDGEQELPMPSLPLPPQQSSPLKHLSHQSKDWRVDDSSPEETEEQLHINDVVRTKETEDSEHSNEAIAETQDEEQEPPVPSFPSPQDTSPLKQLSHRSRRDRRVDDTTLLPSDEKDEEGLEDHEYSYEDILREMEEEADLTTAPDSSLRQCAEVNSLERDSSLPAKNDVTAPSETEEICRSYDCEKILTELEQFPSPTPTAKQLSKIELNHRRFLSCFEEVRSYRSPSSSKENSSSNIASFSKATRTRTHSVPPSSSNGGEEEGGPTGGVNEENGSVASVKVRNHSISSLLTSGEEEGPIDLVGMEKVDKTPCPPGSPDCSKGTTPTVAASMEPSLSTSCSSVSLGDHEEKSTKEATMAIAITARRRVSKDDGSREEGAGDTPTSAELSPSKPAAPTMSRTSIASESSLTSPPTTSCAATERGEEALAEDATSMSRSNLACEHSGESTSDTLSPAPCLSWLTSREQRKERQRRIREQLQEALSAARRDQDACPGSSEEDEGAADTNAIATIPDCGDDALPLVYSVPSFERTSEKEDASVKTGDHTNSEINAAATYADSDSVGESEDTGLSADEGPIDSERNDEDTAIVNKGSSPEDDERVSPPCRGRILSGWARPKRGRRQKQELSSPLASLEEDMVRRLASIIETAIDRASRRAAKAGKKRRRGGNLVSMMKSGDNDCNGGAFFDTRPVPFNHDEEADLCGSLQKVVDLVVEEEQSRKKADLDSLQQPPLIEIFCCMDGEQNLGLLDLISDVLTGKAFVPAQAAARSQRATVIMLPPSSVAHKILKSLSYLIRNASAEATSWYLLSNGKLMGLMDLPIELYGKGNGGKGMGSNDTSNPHRLDIQFASFLRSLAVHVRPGSVGLFLHRRSGGRQREDKESSSTDEGHDDKEEDPPSFLSFPLYTRALQLFSSSSCLQDGMLGIGDDEDMDANPGRDLIRLSASDVCLGIVSLLAPPPASASSPCSSSSKSIESDSSGLDTNTGGDHASATGSSPPPCFSESELNDLSMFVSDPSNARALASPVTGRLVRLAERLEDSIRTYDAAVRRQRRWRRERPQQPEGSAAAEKGIVCDEEQGEEVSGSTSDLSIELMAGADGEDDVGPLPAVQDACASDDAGSSRDDVGEEISSNHDDSRGCVRKITKIVWEIEAELLLLNKILGAGLEALHDQVIEQYFDSFVTHCLVHPLMIVPIEAGSAHDNRGVFPASTFSDLLSTSEGENDDSSCCAPLSQILGEALFPPEISSSSSTPCLNDAKNCQTNPINCDEQSGECEAREEPLTPSSAIGEISSDPWDEGIDLAPAKAALLGFVATFRTLSTDAPLKRLLFKTLFSARGREEGSDNNCSRLLLSALSEGSAWPCAVPLRPYAAILVRSIYTSVKELGDAEGCFEIPDKNEDAKGCFKMPDKKGDSSDLRKEEGSDPSGFDLDIVAFPSVQNSDFVTFPNEFPSHPTAFNSQQREFDNDFTTERASTSFDSWLHFEGSMASFFETNEPVEVRTDTLQWGLSSRWIEHMEEEKKHFTGESEWFFSPPQTEDKCECVHEDEMLLSECTGEAEEKTQEEEKELSLSNRRKISRMFKNSRTIAQSNAKPPKGIGAKRIKEKLMRRGLSSVEGKHANSSPHRRLGSENSNAVEEMTSLSLRSVLDGIV